MRESTEQVIHRYGNYVTQFNHEISQINLGSAGLHPSGRNYFSPPLSYNSLKAAFLKLFTKAFISAFLILLTLLFLRKLDPSLKHKNLYSLYP
jgi:hypothetical protein